MGLDDGSFGRRTPEHDPTAWKIRPRCPLRFATQRFADAKGLIAVPQGNLNGIEKDRA
jgi:hypothetical protein